MALPTFTVRAETTLTGNATTQNVIQDNTIGLIQGGFSALGNSEDGVLVHGGASLNQIVGGNVIAANGTNGVAIMDGSSLNQVTGNVIGTDKNNTPNLGNGAQGVLIAGASSTNTIGGAGASLPNVLSGNDANGIEITGTSTGNLILGNLIGTTVDGAAALPNLLNGIVVFSPANQIGGAAAGAGNVVSGNQGAGIVLSGSHASGNQILGNLVGVDALGSAALPNIIAGLELSAGAHSNSIGGPAAGDRNVISGNDGPGVLLLAASANVIQGDSIGCDAAGLNPLPNMQDGVDVFNGSSANSIGGPLVRPGARRRRTPSRKYRVSHCAWPCSGVLQLYVPGIQASASAHTLPSRLPSLAEQIDWEYVLAARGDVYVTASILTSTEKYTDIIDGASSAQLLPAAGLTWANPGEREPGSGGHRRRQRVPFLIAELYAEVDALGPEVALVECECGAGWSH
ncbi:MAG TPA: hypothetical protein VK395_16625 [Gemmataceae bacterium]|nr:hypothetical protein [Gemmataceae bacterium]